MESLNDVGVCNTQHKPCGKLQILSQQIDYLRFGPLSSNLDWQTVERRFDYLDIRKTNYWGKWFVDIAGNDWELIRTIEPINDVLQWCSQAHWTRLDIAFDVIGIDLETVIQPGTVISNGGNVETLYSCHLRKRGEHDVFIRIYDANKALHDVEPGVVRCEVEFKGNLPDIIKGKDGNIDEVYALAAMHIARKFEIYLPIEFRGEIEPRRRVLEHNRERFYRRYGKQILIDVTDMGYQGFTEWLRECTRQKEGRDENL